MSTQYICKMWERHKPDKFLMGWHKNKTYIATTNIKNAIPLTHVEANAFVKEQNDARKYKSYGWEVIPVKQ